MYVACKLLNNGDKLCCNHFMKKTKNKIKKPNPFSSYFPGEIDLLLKANAISECLAS